MKVIYNMGDMADDWSDRCKLNEAMQYERLEKYAQENWNKYQKKILKWNTKDGDGIYVHLMTTSHVANTKKLLERNKEPNPVQRKWIEIFRIELIKRQTDR